MKSGSCTAQSLKWKSLVVVTVLVMQIGQLEAQTERFLQSLSGAFKEGDSCVVKDDKFSVPEKWASIEKHLSVENIITFELRYDTQANYFNRNFSCTLQADIEYETADRIKEQIKNVSLELNYDTAAGVTHQGIAWYKFKNGHHVKLTVKKITSAAWGNKLPPIFRIRNEIIIDRLYLLDTKKPLEKVTVSNAKAVADRILLQKVTGIDHNGARIAGEVDKHLTIQWDVSDPSFPQYDIEWTFYDATSMIGNKIQDGTFDFSQGALESVFKNNSSRVTVSIPVYLLPEVYNKGWIFYRIRGVRFDEITGTRTEAVWSYAGNYLFNNFTYGLLEVAGHEELLNWQYTISFAEEGKRKEIVNYFDGSLRHRQLVTLSNDNAGSTAIVQENIFDALGRPAVNVLPAPTEETGIHYFQLFNRSAVTGSGYSYTDFDIPASCATAPSAMSTATGASQYYSPLNPSKSDNSNAFFFSKYIPDAFGYPFVVTAFTPDNTDRIRVQGGNGFLYQPGKVTASDDHTTRYYYATPQQDELDRLFGNEAGNAGHFLKNMVIDENGQASIAYINASGKTVATALAGNHPDNVQALPSCQLTNTEVITTLTDRDNIVRDEAALTLTYNSAFLAAATGAITLHYTFIPLSLQVLYGVQNEKICADCYYDLIINVSDDCGNQIQSINKEAVFTEKITCSPAPVEQEGEFPVTISHPGEYHITYRLQLSRKAIDYYVDQYLLQNTALKNEIDFQRDYLDRLDLSACFNNCETCLADLGDEQHFITRITYALQQDSIIPNDGDVVWIKGMYRQLLDACTLSQLGCGKTVLPCEEQTVQLKEDVRPGGQYMLFDAGSGRFIDRDLNVFLRNRDALTAQVNINGTARPFNQLTESDIINNWQDEWSDLLLPYHPENKNNCLIADCEKNAGVEQYEKLFFNTTDAAAAKSRLFGSRMITCQ